MIAVPERDIAAMFARDGSGNAQAKADACLGRIARRLAPIERRENLLVLLGRNARPIVLDDNHDATGFANHLDARDAAIFDGVINQVRDRATNQDWPAGN